jgi:hypothetical protein
MVHPSSVATGCQKLLVNLRTTRPCFHPRSDSCPLNAFRLMETHPQFEPYPQTFMHSQWLRLRYVGLLHDIRSCCRPSGQILSGLEPYHDLPTEYAVFLHILHGGRPSRAHLDHDAVTIRMWRLLTSMWNQTPHLRPEIADAAASLIQMWVSPRISLVN